MLHLLLAMLLMLLVHLPVIFEWLGWCQCLQIRLYMMNLLHLRLLLLLLLSQLFLQWLLFLLWPSLHLPLQRCRMYWLLPLHLHLDPWNSGPLLHPCM